MHIAGLILGFVIIFSVLLDAFETVVLPRRITRQFRLTAWFYRRTWVPWRRLASKIQPMARRESFLGYFGPLSLIFLLAFWATGLIFGFALLQFGAGEHVRLSGEPITFGTLVYHSGETFFTLGYGDIVPATGPARAVAVIEAGMGFAFLGVVIGYLPTIYSAFSRREIEISMNHPLRYGGLTFYQYQMDAGQVAQQAGHTPSSVLEVVHNPSWLTPYVGCIMVGLGLAYQFTIHLVGFVSKRK